MSDKRKLQRLGAAEGEERLRFFSEIIYPYLKDYRMMNEQEFDGYSELLSDPLHSERTWNRLVEMYKYTMQAVKKYNRKKDEFPVGMEDMDW